MLKGRPLSTGIMAIEEPNLLARDSVLQSDSSLNSSATTNGMESSGAAIGGGNKISSSFISVMSTVKTKIVAAKNCRAGPSPRPFMCATIYPSATRWTLGAEIESAVSNAGPSEG
jgi:hypothetical protein